MTSPRTPLSVAAGLAATIACLVIPAAASAETFCVASPSNCAGGTSQPSIHAALTASAGNGANKDVIRVGIGLFDGAAIVDTAGNPVSIIGEGLNKTAFSLPTGSSSATVLDVQEPNTDLQKLRVHVDNPAATAGIKLAGADATDVLVSGTMTDALDGFALSGDAEVSDSSVDLICPANLQCRGIFATAGSTPTVRDTYVSGTVGVAAIGDATVRRMRIKATQGVVASSGSQTEVADTVISVPGSFASNFQIAGLAAAGNGTTHLEADRVTVAGNDGPGYGVWVVPNGGAGNDATVDLQGSVIDGVSTDLVESSNGGATGSIAVSWTGYRTGSTSGTVSNGGNNLNLTGLDPKLVGGGQFVSPAHDSPLVDRGDPAYLPFLGGLDALSNTRVRDGNANGTARVDLGGLEYQRLAPDAQAAPPAPGTALVGETIAFAGTGTSDPDPGETEALTYVWTFDDGTTANGESVQHAFATAGPHSATLTVTDPTGLSDQATVNVAVNAPPAPPPPGPDPAPNPNPNPNPNPPAKNVAPKLTNVWVGPKSFRPRKGKKGGTSIRLTLSEAATLTFTVERSAKGRRVKGKCVKQTKKNRKAKGCTRWVRAGSFTARSGPGKKTVAWSGKLAGKNLKPGPYRIAVRATDAGGLRSAVLLARFTVKS